MAKSNLMQFGFGEVEIRENLRSRNMRIRISPRKGIVVTIPKNCPQKRINEFISENEPWIIKNLEKSKKIKDKITLFTPDTVFKTYAHTLKIETHSKPSLKFVVNQSGLTVYYPGYALVEDEKIQNFIRHAITETLRFEAKKYLPHRVKDIAEKHALECGAITVRNNKTRWGSCSGKNNISLNIHVMRLPQALIDYVICHELAHIRVKNHKKEFWNYLDKIYPGAKMYDKMLNQYHLVYW